MLGRQGVFRIVALAFIGLLTAAPAADGQIWDYCTGTPSCYTCYDHETGCRYTYCFQASLECT